LFVDYFNELLAGGDAVEHLGTQGLFFYRRDEILDHLVIDIGF